MALLPLLVLFVVPWNAEGQDAADSSRVVLTGSVVDAATREPLADVTLRFPRLDLTRISDENGEFEALQLPLGTYLLSLTRHGYKVAEGDFTVRQAGSFTFELNPLRVDPSAEPSRVVGVVTDRDTGEPIATARVTVLGKALDALTTGEGRFEFPNVPPGVQAVRVEHLGYGTREDSVFIPAGRTVDLRIQVEMTPIPVEGITVSVDPHDRFLEVSGFYQRRNWGFGNHWTREQILDRDPLFVTDLIRTVPGLILERGEFRWSIYSRRRNTLSSAAPCQLAVYVDGVVMADFDLDSLDPRGIAAVEVYHGQETPLEYHHNCGVILVWLR